MNETAILDALQTIHTPALDSFVAAFTWMGNVGQLWIVLGIVLVCIPHTRRLGAAVLIAFGLGTLITSGIIKPLLMRPRPCDINPAIQLIVDRPFGSSFPSGHTTSAFASAFALFFMKNPRAPKALIIVVFILAAFMAFTRLYCYVHYPTDVLAGILVGLFSGFLSAKILSAYNTNHPIKEQ
ncbi:phosphatase PAP2 family protein [Adlercreutzia agrestimuris]|uniref:phosphatase PAP2 family protein n=1 Tax=Adlercreutzia agrestimuris TaxID=2941324 RepID=UPI00203DB68E|nr:phosphatase PAP2 family protein [Adlercreutzia agrestimuris]